MIRRETPIGELMTKSPLHIDAELTLADAGARMAGERVRHLPVMADHRLVGMISARDILLLEALPGVDPKSITVDSAMTANPITCKPTAPLSEVLQLMEEQAVGAVPVVEEGRLLGIFTTVDAVSLLRRALV